MQAWIDRLAETLGEEPLSERDSARLLAAARDVAHRVERRITPLAAFLLGSAVGRREAAGGDRPEALDAMLAELARLLPTDPSDAASQPTG